jgi:hypothetical protein
MPTSRSFRLTTRLALATLAAALLSPPTAAGAFLSLLASGTYIGPGEDLDFRALAGTLIMPFDLAAGHTDRQEVSRTGDPSAAAVVASHWSYWRDDGSHLADVFICLQSNDTVVVDPRALQGRSASNDPIGPVIDLEGAQGFVVVTAYEAMPGPGCQVVDPTVPLAEQLIGSWTIANSGKDTSFGGDAIGLETGVLPDADDLDGGIALQTLNPQTLNDSAVILIGVESGAGQGAFRDTEVGPVSRSFAASSGLSKVCCNTTVFDTLSTVFSLPDTCFQAAGFRPIADNAADPGETSILQGFVTLSTAGSLQLKNCVSQDTDGSLVPVGHGSVEQFVFAFHGQAL